MVSAETVTTDFSRAHDAMSTTRGTGPTCSWERKRENNLTAARQHWYRNPPALGSFVNRTIPSTQVSFLSSLVAAPAHQLPCYRLRAYSRRLSRLDWMMDSVAAAAAVTTIIISVGFVRFYLQLCLIRCYALRENFCSHKDGNNGRRLTASAMAMCA
ncbi:uncharacterized protein LOC120904623 [Anopheles arabiensis]|uniref:uncharacterized protein LOC120904623 n=1 Tax=Anopheles arabiensis TaxID=7173 RepID=UPI001AAD7E23|nr:uncharacterized protein LOC120904623 [Anopheles arabiensis]